MLSGSDKVSYDLLDSAPDKDVIDDEPQFRVKKVAIEMIFRDTGCGISNQNKKNLFMNFSKLHENRNNNKDGVGLGLSICKEIIMSQGGSIDIQSELGRGTDFIISLEAKCRVEEAKLREATQHMEEYGYDSF